MVHERVAFYMNINFEKSMEEGMGKGTWMVNFYYNFDDVYQHTAH